MSTTTAERRSNGNSQGNGNGNISRVSRLRTDSYYERRNRYRRGSSASQSDTSDDDDYKTKHDGGDEYYKGRLMNTHIEAHRKNEWSLTERQVPRLLRRRYIISGYRIPHKECSFYVRSACWEHNETINVWTHALPFVFYLWQFWTTNDWKNLTPLHYPRMILQFVTLTLYLGSASAHLLHSRSKLHHIFWFMVDFCTISTFVLGIGVQRYYDVLNTRVVNSPSSSSLATIASPSMWHEHIYIPALLCVAFMHFSSMSYFFVTHPYHGARVYQRMLCSLLAALFLYIPIMPAYSVAGHSGLFSVVNDNGALTAHSKAFIWLVLSGIFMGGHVPERFCRGQFDIYGYGHQLFHIFVIMVAHNLLNANDILLSDNLKHYDSTLHSANLTGFGDVFAPLVTLGALNLLVMWLLYVQAKQKHK